MRLEDIAQKAGVSRSTVSRVINNDPNVNDETRSRVWSVIEREGYIPNPMARAMVTRRTNVIGVVVPQSINVFFGDNSYYPQLLQGMSEMIAARDNLMLLILPNNNETREQFAQRITKNRLLDGVILCSVQVDDPILTNVLALNQIVVSVERPNDQLEDRVSYITIDNCGAAKTMVQHLIDLGYRRIGHVTGHMNITDGLDRLAGYKQALEEAGLPVDPNLISEGNFSYEYGYDAMKKLLPQRPDAVFAAGDTTAQGAIQAIVEAGLRIPDDIAIVGFDDLDVAIKTNPPLTTMRHPIQEKGMQAVSLLLDLIDKVVEGPQRILLPTQLVIRESCGAKYRT
ncbi:MAG: LacI family DNA-binding transcriptional regulator [Anaerolineaceae bacterium]|nr:LacI family DNA-binding transcriptional regulator [Anaerolineaceae bacterium]